MIYYKIRKTGRNYPNKPYWCTEGFNSKHQKETWDNLDGGFCFKDQGDEILEVADMPEEQFIDRYRKEIYSYLLKPESDLGWLSPCGDWYGCDWANHEEFAALYLGTDSIVLEEEKWVKVFRSFELGEPAYVPNRITPAQRVWLEDHNVKQHYC